MLYYGEMGYLCLLTDVISRGIDVSDRTGVGRRKLFAPIWQCDVETDFPAFTSRGNNPIAHGFKEYMFFLNGGTNTKHLEDQGVTFWKGNTSREFLDKRGLTTYVEGSYGKAYGFQLRHFNGDLEDNGTLPVGGIDQIKDLVDNLKRDPYSSRHVVSMWNPSQTSEMALPPCWYDHQFLVLPNRDSLGKDTLELRVTARSCDLLFGTPMNVAQYGFYLKAMASLLGLTAGKLIVVMTDAHLYFNQIDYATELLSRKFQREGGVQCSINKTLNTLDDLLSLQWSDIALTNYNVNKEPFKTPRPQMAV